MFKWLLSWLWVSTSKESLYKQNGYPNCVINNPFKEFQGKQHETAAVATDNEKQNVKNYLLMLRYKVWDGMHIISSMRKQINRAFPDDVKMAVSYTDTRPSTCFDVEDKMLFNHEHDNLYYAKYPQESCLHDYVGESGKRVLEWAKYHNGRGAFSHMFKHCVVADHQFASCDNFRIAGRKYFINWTNFIVWLSLLLEVLGNMRFAICYCPVSNVINFEVNHCFLIKLFFYISKKSGQ